MNSLCSRVPWLKEEPLLYAECTVRHVALLAKACFQRALATACQQQVNSLELRATMSLSHLWQQQGKRQAAHDLPAPIYDWFTEGFDTANLREAQALLNALGA